MNTQYKFLLIFFFTTPFAISQDTILVKMTRNEGLVPFFRSQPTLNLEKDISKFTVVDNLKNFIIKSFSVFPEHSAYQKLQNKLISEQEFINTSKIYDIDSSKIYKGHSKSIIYCLVGTSSIDDREIVVIDQNGDFDFNNDYKFTFDFIPNNIKLNQSGFFDNREVNKLIDEQIPAVKVMVEGFYDTTRYSKTLLIKPIPYNTGFRYNNEIEQELHLSIELYEHLEGTFMLNENKYYLSLYNLLPCLSFKKKSFKVLFRKEKEDYNPQNSNNFTNSLIIENKKYLIESVSRFGDEITLRYAKE